MENLLPKSMLGSNRRPILAGAAALILATILLLVYLSHYRSSVKSSNATSSVLVAQSFIPKGTSSLEVAKKGDWEITPISKEELKPDAVADAAVFKGQVALDDIYPGQQIAISDFGATATSTSLSASPILLGEGRTAGKFRAVAIPLDSSHGIAPQAVTGDHVDVYLQNAGSLTLLMQNVLILSAPGQAAENSAAPTSGNYILRVPNPMVGRFMFAADNTKMWFALVPQKGSKPAKRTFIDSSNLIPVGSG